MIHFPTVSRVAMLLSVISSSVFCASVQAQQIIPIDAEEITRMGILFAPVRSMENSAGARFPATVINSPNTASNLSALHDAVIEQWRVAAGESVAAGDILVALRSQEILQHQSEWLGAVSTLNHADFELRKDEGLFAQGLISAQRLSQSRTVHQQAVIAESASRQTLSHSGFSATRLRELRDDNEHLGLYYIVAPADGTLSRRAGAVGESVDAGTVVAGVSNSENHWISAQVPARVAASLQVGQLLSLANSTAQLVLRQKDTIIDSSNQTITLLAEFTSAASVTPGQVISVVMPPAAEGILIPDRAVVHAGNETTVYVRTDAGIEARVLNLRPVGADYLAESGLTVGDRVVVQGTAVLKGIQLGLGGGE